MDNLPPLNQFIADIAAGEADDRAMAVFEDLAQRDIGAWRRLALTLHDELHMRRELTAHLDSSSRRADDEIDRALHLASTQASAHPPRRTALRPAMWSGWAVAAALLLAVAVLLPQRSIDGIDPVTDSAALATFSAQQALDQYIAAGTEEGRVVAELPTVMVEARPTDEGRIEVLYLRQFLEREQVAEVYTVSVDEHGDPHPVKTNVSMLDDPYSPI